MVSLKKHTFFLSVFPYLLLNLSLSYGRILANLGTHAQIRRARFGLPQKFGWLEEQIGAPSDPL